MERLTLNITGKETPALESRGHVCPPITSPLPSTQLGLLRLLEIFIEGMDPFHNLDSLQLSPGSLPFSPPFPHMAFPGPSNVLVNLTLALKHYTQQNKGLVINQTYPPWKGFSKVFTKNEVRLDQGSRAVLKRHTHTLSLFHRVYYFKLF